MVYYVLYGVFLLVPETPIMEVLDAPSDFAYYFLIAIVFLYYIPFALKIHKNAPQYLRRYSLMHLIGGILGCVSFCVWEIDRVLPSITVFNNIPGIEALLFIGISLILIPQYIKPQLAYILPFRVQRITVVDTNSGMPLFSYYWNKNKENVDEILFAGMIQGVTGIVNEAARKGNINYIKLDQGVLIIERSNKFPVAFVLVSNTTSRSLTDSLHNFSEKFIEKYASLFGQLNDGRDYENATEIVSKCFSFIPDFSS
jgi:hypothetical protein